MRRFCVSLLSRLAAVLMIVSPASPLAAAPFDRLVPAAAHAPGQAGTFFQTDLDLSNPGPAAVDATLVYLPRNQDNGALSRTAVVPVAGESTVHLVDVLGVTFGEASAAGAILVRSASPLVVRSRTYNRGTLDGREATWGQSFDGVAPGAAFGPGRTAQVAGLRGDGLYRSNLGLASFAATPHDVTVTLRSDSGEQLAQRVFTLAPWMPTQVNDVFAGFGITSDGKPVRAEITATDSGARFLAYGSVIDGATGDPTTILARGSGEAGTSLLLPAAARAEAAGGAFFVTDLVLFHPGEGTASVSLSFRPFGGGEPTTQALSLAPGQSRLLVDLVGAGLFGLESGAGSVAIASDLPILADARIYNRQARGPEATGTAGQEMPAVAGGLVPCATARMLGLEKSLAFRTNLGLANLATVPATVRLALLNKDGGPVATTTVALAPLQSTQLNDVLGTTFGLAAFPGGALDATLVSESCGGAALAADGGPVALYASRVDNVSGDPTTLLAETIGPLSVVATATPPKGSAPLAVSFSAAVTGAWGDLVTASWDFGDGSPAASGPTATHTYAVPGRFTATFHALDQAGQEAIVPVLVDSLAGFELACGGDPRRGKIPLEVAFSGEATAGTPPYAYGWDFGDGGSATGNVVWHTYTTAGIFDAVLTATDARGLTESCTEKIFVLDCPVPVVETFAVSPTTICAGDTAQLTWRVTGATSVSISPGIGTVASQGQLAVSPATTTDFVITAESDCGDVEETVRLVVNQPPSITVLSITPNPVAFGQKAFLSVQVTGSGPTKVTSALGNSLSPSSFSGNGTYTISYTANVAAGNDTITFTSTNGCGTTVVTASITVN